MVVLSNIIIKTFDNYINEVVDFLNDNNIKFTIKKYPIKNYDYFLNNFGLPPYNIPEYIKKTVYFYFKKTDNNFDIIFNNDLFIQSKSNYINSFSYKYLYNDNYNVVIKNNYIIKYPIYVVSFNRFNLRSHTIDFLEQMNIKYYICIQEQELENYKSSIKKFNWKSATLITSINTTDGSYIQRNKCLTHSYNNGFEKCWILDDNIRGWYYYNNNTKTRLLNHCVFSFLENIIDNIKEPCGIISHNYYMDLRTQVSPLQINTKNYSSCLINTKLLFDNNIKFRLKYNEDVDLTLQILQKGFKTVSTNFLLCLKMPTLRTKGGNTDSIYKNTSTTDDKFKEKYLCLKNHWDLENPDISKYISFTIKKHNDNRIHHQVNYIKICKFLNNTKYITPIIKKAQTIL